MLAQRTDLLHLDHRAVSAQRAIEFVAELVHHDLHLLLNMIRNIKPAPTWMERYRGWLYDFVQSAKATCLQVPQMPLHQISRLHKAAERRIRGVSGTEESHHSAQASRNRPASVAANQSTKQTKNFAHKYASTGLRLASTAPAADKMSQACIRRDQGELMSSSLRRRVANALLNAT